MGKYVVERKVDVSKLIKGGVRSIYEVGFSSIYWNIAKNSFRSLNPVVYFGVKVCYGAIGAGLGRWMYSFVDTAFDLEDKIDAIFEKSDADCDEGEVEFES